MKMYYENQRKKGMRYVCLLVCVLVMLLTSVESQAATGKPSLSRKKLNMNVGKQERLSVKNQKGYMVSWKSSKKAVATISKTGNINAKKSGSTRITAIVKPNRGGKAYRLICKVSVKKGKEQGNAAEGKADNGKNFDSSGKLPVGPTECPILAVPSGSNTAKPEPAASDSATAAPSASDPTVIEDLPAPGQPISDPVVPGQPDENVVVPNPPADSVTGSAVNSGEAKLLFGNYNDGLMGVNGEFFGNQIIVSYEQLQNLIHETKEVMESNTLQYYGRDRLQWYINQMETIKQDYFTDHVLCINTMMVARGYDYTLDFAAKVVEGDGTKALHLWLKRHNSLKDGECVTCDLPDYSYFIQVPRELVQECENVVCILVDSEERIPSDDPEHPYVTPDILRILDQIRYPVS